MTAGSVSTAPAPRSEASLADHRLHVADLGSRPLCPRGGPGGGEQERFRRQRPQRRVGTVGVEPGTWPRRSPSQKARPSSNSRTSSTPRRTLVAMACTTPGRRLVRSTLHSSLSGLSSRIGVRPAPWPCSAAANDCDTKDHVMASSKPAPISTSLTRSSTGVSAAMPVIAVRRPGSVLGTRS